MTNAAQRLERFRALLSDLGADAAVVLTSDPHFSEYVDPHWAMRAALSGFTGSAGTLLVTKDAAALIADSRYWLQAEKQLVSGIELIPQTKSAWPDLAAEWLAAHLSPGDKVLSEANVMPIKSCRRLDELLQAKNIGLDLIDEFSADDAARFWPDRPAQTLNPVYAAARPCVERSAKLEALRADMADLGASSLYLSSLDDIAWTTNLRGSDIANNPVFDADMLVGRKDAVLFVDERRVSPDAVAALACDGIRIEAPSALMAALASAAETGTLLFDPNAATARVFEAVRNGNTVEAPSVAARRKAVKSAEEIEAIDEAMLRDAVALVEFYAELDERLKKGEKLTEMDASSLLHAHRAAQPGFLDESFPTIAAYGPNAALPHYQPSSEKFSVLESGNLLLIDSGAQFDCGTTDVTRMTAIGEITAEMRRDATLVTRSMLRLLCAKLPYGATGAQADVLARMDLWAAGLDFGHGAGHGVGYCLNVHEDPVRISPAAKNFTLEPGNVTSDEPGLYRAGQWGVRVENMMVVERAEETPFGAFIRFRSLTCCPIDVRALEEPFGDFVGELNAFNAWCRKRLEGCLTERAAKWLEMAARPLA